uniref:Uncharacterized protein n=1 Tax=Leersia perrieri TaxID=77586 RepID=A0A0D9VW44_9ORYZ
MPPLPQSSSTSPGSQNKWNGGTIAAAAGRDNEVTTGKMQMAAAGSLPPCYQGPELEQMGFSCD